MPEPKTVTLSDGMKWTKLTEIEGRHLARLQKAKAVGEDA